MKNILTVSYCFAVLFLYSCGAPHEEQSGKTTEKIFESLTIEQTGVDFNNELAVTDSINFFTYGYFYMGGGVAVGDFNQDNLKDLYFTGNLVENKLYLNQGELAFDDITAAAGVAGDDRWMTGCSVVDINNDGWDDIYVSVAGNMTTRKNILYVNQGLNEEGVPVFEDMAEDYGLADEGGSIQTAFFDYDNDGDLDVYVANYEITPFHYNSTEFKGLMDSVVWSESSHLYRNDGGSTFTDVTEEAGVLCYGLSIGVIAADFNNDGWTDLYESNDFHTPDNFYLNQGDGTFKEISHESLLHTSFYGMGVDAADYNNDGYMDLFQMDMAEIDHFRSKSNMAAMNIPGFWNLVHYGMHHQYMFNTLQTCQGVRENGLPFYAETAKLSGLHKTAWSWACLFGDYDNDGYKDLYVTNGTRRDINNRDVFAWYNRMDIKLKVQYKYYSPQELVDKMPFKRVDNFIYSNQNGEKFKKSNDDWGLHYEGFSNGATHADLDNDGDLELIVNNIDSTAAIFQNFAVERLNNNFIQLSLEGPKGNIDGLGAKFKVTTADGQTQYHEHTLVRGYQSSVDDKLHFGIGKHDTVDKIIVTWPDGQEQVLTNIPANSVLQINYADATIVEKTNHQTQHVFTASSAEGLVVSHQENKFDDFTREILLPHKMSTFGPALAVGDVNADGIDDVFIGGSKGVASCLKVSQKGEAKYAECVSIGGVEHEDTDALFFDADGDGDLDLYVVSGGNEEAANNIYYNDRLYQNTGEGDFVLLSTALPILTASGGVVISADYDNDGDQDLFVGGRQVPGKYPSPADSYLLENKSTAEVIRFQEVSGTKAPDFDQLGMVTDAVWDDYDDDNDLDLIVVGEWMPITIIENKGGHFSVKKYAPFDELTTGWWNTIEKADFDGDGDNDYVVGNLGLNYKYKASVESSFDVYAADFDDNGQQDIVLGYYQNGVQFPVRGKQCSTEQIPDVSKRFASYDAFAGADIADVYSADKLENSLHYQAVEFGHLYIENNGDGTFDYKRLPIHTQIAAINAIEVFDVNEDGHLDMVIGGNLFNAEIETPRSDACYGWLLYGSEDGDFEFQPYDVSGLYVPYQTQDIKLINKGSEQACLVFANNNAPVRVYQVNSNKTIQ